MKVSKSLLAVIAMAGTMGFSAVASAMDFTVYGSLRGGLQQAGDDDSMSVQVGNQVEAINAGITAEGVLDAAGVDATSSANQDAVTFGGQTIRPAAVVEVATDADTDAEEAKRDANLELLRAAAGDFYTGGAASDDIDATEIVTSDVEARDAQLQLGHGFAGSRIGVRGSEDLGNGAEAGLHWEVNVGGAGETAGGRHANVWYSGAFGKVTIGQQGNPYRNAANWDQSWWIGGNNRYGDGGSRLQGVRYDGDAGAFNFSVMATANSDNGYTDDGLAEARTVDISADGTLIGANQLASTAEISYDEVESETGIDSWIATGHYDMGVATINLGYRVDNNEAQAVGQSWDNFVISANGTLDALDWYIAFESNTDNTNVKRTDTPIVFDANGTASTTVRTTALVEADTTANANTKAVADSLATAHDVTTIGLFLGYHLSDVSTIYFEWEDSANDGLDVLGENLDRTATLLGFSRSIGPNTSFIAEYVSVDNGSELSADSTTLQGYLKVDF